MKSLQSSPFGTLFRLIGITHSTFSIVSLPLILISLCLFPGLLIITSCGTGSPSGLGGSAISGNWIPQIAYVKGYDRDGNLVQDTSYDYNDLFVQFDMEMILEITRDSMIAHMRIEDEYEREGYGYKLEGNQITGEIIEDLIGDSSMLLLSYTGVIKNNQLVLGSEVEYDSAYEEMLGYKTENNEVYYEWYSGPVPPPDWPPLIIIEDDTYEPDNSYSTATSIPSDGTLQTHILTEGDQDWCSFSAEVDITYVIKTTGNTDTFLDLYDTDGTTWLDDDDDDDDMTGLGEGMNAVILWECEKTGTNYFRVTAFDDLETGAYNISVETYGYTRNPVTIKKRLKTYKRGINFHFNYMVVPKTAKK